MNKSYSNRFAVIEDQPLENEALVRQIKEVHRNAQIEQFFNLETALKALESSDFDVVISDINLDTAAPKRYHAVQIAQLLFLSNTPLIIISGLNGEVVLKAIFSELGAWDYIVKPYDSVIFQKKLTHAIDYRKGQLLSNDLNHVRRKQNRDPDLKIDLSMRAEVKWKNIEVRLTLTQIKIVDLLSSNSNTTIKYEELFTLIDSGQNRENIRVHIMGIREAFKAKDPSFDRIVSVILQGYCWHV